MSATQIQSDSTQVAYLTSYDGILCGKCALRTDNLANDGRKWLASLTALESADLWPGACCEECKAALHTA